MKSLSLYSKVLRNAWLIETAEAEAYLPAVMQLITGQEVKLYDDESNKETKPFALSPFTLRKYSSLDEAPAGSIAVINVEDVLDKDDYCGTPGTKTLTAMLEDALSKDNIIGAVLNIDSPGGSPYGTESFANAIKSAEKPIVAFVEGRAASAAYWIAAACDHIVMGGTITRVGSIGTYATIRDYTKYYESMGVKIWEIYATASTEKNAGVRELIEKQDPSKMRTQDIDPINAAFMSHVTDQRGSKLDLTKENVLSGKMYTGQEAVEVGLADELGSFQDALQAVEDLSNQKPSYNPMFNTRKIKSLNSLLEKSGKGEAITAEDIEAVNEELQANGLESHSLIAHSVIEADAKALKAMRTALQNAVMELAPETEHSAIESFDVAASIRTLKAANVQLTTERDALKIELGTATPPTPAPVDGQQQFTPDPVAESAGEKEMKALKSLIAEANQLSN